MTRSPLQLAPGLTRGESDPRPTSRGWGRGANVASTTPNNVRVQQLP